MQLYLLYLPVSVLCRKAVFAIVLLCGTGIAALPQQPYTIVHYDETRLPQTTIGDMQQDESGYLWMKTQFGIVRFDGAGVKVFTTKNQKGLSSNRIRVCAKNIDNEIYFVDENHHFLKVSAPNRLMQVQDREESSGLRLALYGAQNSDFLNFDMTEGLRFKRFADTLQWDETKELTLLYTLDKMTGYIFYPDIKQQLRLCYIQKSNYYSKVLDSSFTIQHTFKLGNRLFHQSSASGALLFDSLVTLPVPVKGLLPLPDNFFLQNEPVVFSNASGTFFYAQGNLYQYTWNGAHITATLLYSGLPCTGVSCIVQERHTGDIIIGTQSNGFYQVKKRQFSVVNFVQRRKEGDSVKINDNIVYAIVPWNRNHLFSNAYLAASNGNEPAQQLRPYKVTGFNRYFFYKQDSTTLWLQYKETIESLNTITGNRKMLLRIWEPKKIIPLGQNRKLIITENKIGIWKNGYFTLLYQNDSQSFKTAEKVTDERIILGGSKGLYYFSLTHNSLQRVKSSTNLEVRFLYRDKDDRIWLTTYGQGLYHVAGAALTLIAGDNTGYLSVAHSIVQDKEENFWISTNHGLFKISYASLIEQLSGKSKKLYYTYFDKNDGFNTNEFNGGCYPSGLYDTARGYMYFPSMDGIVKFNPERIKPLAGGSAVFIDEVISNDTLHQPVVNARLRLNKQTASIRISFSTPYYGNTANVTFSYALSTNPDQWIELGNGRSIALNNLPGGNYTLIIKKEEAARAPVLTRLNFDIEKKFTETIWFKLLLLVGVISMVYLYFKARLLYLNKERQRLEKEVAVRTADQLKLIDQLKDSIALLTQLQENLSQMIGHKENIIAVLIHDIKSPLRFLKTVADHLNRSLEAHPNARNKEMAREIATSLSQLYLFTQDFAIWLNASTPGQIKNSERVHLESTVAEILTVYNEMAEVKSISFQQITKLQFVYTDGQMLKSVIRNLVDNAVKNTSGAVIIITTSGSEDGSKCKIEIADEGKGLTEKQVAELNHYFYSNEQILPFSSSQFGHKIIRDFLQKLGGSITYRRNYPQGLAVAITLPVV